MKVAVETELVEGRTVVRLGSTTAVADGIFVVPQGGLIDLAATNEGPHGHLRVTSCCNAGQPIAQPTFFCAS